MGAALDAAWLGLTSRFTDFQLASLGSFVIHESVYFLCGLPYLFMEMANVRSYKIQLTSLRRRPLRLGATPPCQNRVNSREAQRKCLWRLMLYHCFVNLPVMVAAYPVFRYMGFSSHLPLPSWYATPFGLTSEYAHPLEILFLGFATIAGPALTGPHLLTLWLWMSIRVVETVEAHCGYDFPWSPSRFLPLYGGADFHDYHHRLLYTKSGNYASTFIYMDWLFGTDKGYRRLKSMQKKSCIIDETAARPAVVNGHIGPTLTACAAKVE
eukprot:SM000061S19259  [mRNA]  locus=s61:395892:398087:+ [translate_table: standard]